MRDFVYPARFTRAPHEGGYVIRFRDIPEAITQADTADTCASEAAGALQAALEARILDGLDIPTPSPARQGERPIAVPVHTALKTALYLAMRDAGISRVELARRMDVNEKEVRRMLDPYHGTRSERLEQALAVLGRHAEVRVA